MTSVNTLIDITKYMGVPFRVSDTYPGNPGGTVLGIDVEPGWNDRPGWDFHKAKWAIDIVCDTAELMRDLARNLYAWPAYQLELIHTTPFPDDNGYYVKNYRRVNGLAVYGARDVAAHLNHIHLAADESHANAWLADLRGRFSDGYPGYYGEGVITAWLL